MKQFIFIFTFIFISSTLFAQEKEDVVYLKNGSVIKGQITEMIPDKHIKIETQGGSLFVYTFDEIDKIEKKEIVASPTFRNVKGKNVTTAQSSIDNVFYIRLGYSSPSWEQFGFTKEQWGETSKSGFLFEFGKIYMLNKISLPENMSIGINADFLSFYWHRFSNNNIDLERGTLRFDSKVGPSFTYSPINKLAFDVYVKADISWMTVTAIVFNNDADNANGYGNIGTVGVSTGFNVRYSKLIIGFEFNTISPKLENVDNEGVYLGNRSTGSEKSPLPSANFSIGLAF